MFFLNLLIILLVAYLPGLLAVLMFFEYHRAKEGRKAQAWYTETYQQGRETPRLAWVLVWFLFVPSYLLWRAFIRTLAFVTAPARKLGERARKS